MACCKSLLAIASTTDSVTDRLLSLCVLFGKDFELIAIAGGVSLVGISPTIMSVD